MSPKVTSPEKEEGADRDGAERDGAERKGGAAESDCYDRNWALLPMAHMTGEMVRRGKRNGKMV